MAFPDIVGREGWLEARKRPLVLEEQDAAWARGTEYLGGAYSLLDLTALGRQEEWEEPKGRAPRLHGADPAFTD
jgi:predicted dithiol-disulfide oxidoreductase (DUF899 family)